MFSSDFGALGGALWATRGDVQGADCVRVEAFVVKHNESRDVRVDSANVLM